MGDDGRDDDVILAYQGLINIYMAKPRNEVYRNFEQRIVDMNIRDNNIVTLPEEVMYLCSFFKSVLFLGGVAFVHWSAKKRQIGAEHSLHY